jgi:lipopolysaccharide transport system ATP-binding protein
MAETPVIELEGVSKKFCRRLRYSLWYGLTDLVAELTGRNAKDDLELRQAEFLAIDNVSFQLRPGECIGLIGPNGAGKSTLLKMLNGLIRPDKGRITMRGRVGALIELGAGFSPVLTGRENIYINGAVLGFSKREIDAKFDEIVDFAELHDAIDAPVQNYSSGMHVRLGFAVAAHLEPSILLIDEVLAVGDASFRLKCMHTIRRKVDSGTSIILVSHQLGHIRNVCNRAVWLDQGKVRNSGYASEVCSSYEYELYQRDNLSGTLPGRAFLDAEGGAEIVDVRFRRDGNRDGSIFSNAEEVRVAVTIKCSRVAPSLFLTFGLRMPNETLVYGDHHELSGWLSGPGYYEIEVRFPQQSFVGGHFYFSCGLARDSEWGHTIHNVPRCLEFYVTSPFSTANGIVDLKPSLSIRCANRISNELVAS